MKKIIEKLKILYVKRKVKQMQKIAVVLTNTPDTTFVEEGPKTFGRLHLVEAANYVMKQIYGLNYEIKLQIVGICFDEDEKNIKVQVWLSRPGMLIGRAGYLVDTLEKNLTKVYDKKTKVRVTEARRLYGMDHVVTL